MKAIIIRKFKWLIWKIRSKLSYELKKRGWLLGLRAILTLKKEESETTFSRAEKVNIQLNSHRSNILDEKEISVIKSAIMRKMMLK